VNYSSLYVKRPEQYVEGRGFNGGLARSTVPQGLRAGTVGFRTEDEGYGAIRALDPHTGDLKWEYKMTEFTQAGILTTASDLVFTGGNEGYFFALNARTGALLWKFTVGGAVASGPMTYSVGGRQYVAVAAGNSLFAFALRQ
jgi:alcohol dehydrogenase (cytochrome c)